MGNDPMTCWLTASRSATELESHIVVLYYKADPGIRTRNPPLTGRTLYARWARPARKSIMPDLNRPYFCLEGRRHIQTRRMMQKWNNGPCGTWTHLIVGLQNRWPPLAVPKPNNKPLCRFTSIIADAGLEPAYTAYEAAVGPFHLNPQRLRPDSNRRSPPWQGGVLLCSTTEPYGAAGVPGSCPAPFISLKHRAWTPSVSNRVLRSFNPLRAPATPKVQKKKTIGFPDGLWIQFLLIISGCLVRFLSKSACLQKSSFYNTFHECIVCVFCIKSKACPCKGHGCHSFICFFCNADHGKHLYLLFYRIPIVIFDKEKESPVLKRIDLCELKARHSLCSCKEYHMSSHLSSDDFFIFLF